MNLAQARIGYASYSADGSAPGDRRRFIAWAKQKSLDWDFAKLGDEFDAYFVTHNADLPGWISRKKRAGKSLPLVFELIDSYLAQTGFTARVTKAAARRILGVDTGLSPDFLATLREMCRVADAVICSTPEQAERISQINPKVAISFDYFGDEALTFKNSYGGSGKLKLVWEGQAVTLRNVMAIAPVLARQSRPIELHLVTDPLAPRILGRFSKVASREILKNLQVEKIFHRWETATFSRQITACDLAIIPMESGDRMMWGKPENKLVLLWTMGMPVLTSATPAYVRAMKEAGIDMACSNEREWDEKLATFAEMSAAERGNLSQRLRRHALERYSPERFCSAFDKAFTLAGFTC